MNFKKLFLQTKFVYLARVFLSDFNFGEFFLKGEEKGFLHIILHVSRYAITLKLQGVYYSRSVSL